MTRATFVIFWPKLSSFIDWCCYYTQVSNTGSWEPLVIITVERWHYNVSFSIKVSLTNFPVIYFRNKGNKSYKISFFSIFKTWLRYCQNAGNGIWLKKKFWPPLESLRRFATLNGDTTDRGPKLLIKLANTTDSLKTISSIGQFIPNEFIWGKQLWYHVTNQNLDFPFYCTQYVSRITLIRYPQCQVPSSDTLNVKTFES